MTPLNSMSKPPGQYLGSFYGFIDTIVSLGGERGFQLMAAFNFLLASDMSLDSIFIPKYVLKYLFTHWLQWFFWNMDVCGYIYKHIYNYPYIIICAIIYNKIILWIFFRMFACSIKKLYNYFCMYVYSLNCPLCFGYLNYI